MISRHALWVLLTLLPMATALPRMAPGVTPVIANRLLQVEQGQIQFGQIADKHAVDPGVREFATRTTAENGRALEELQQLADKRGWHLSNAAEGGHGQGVRTLGKSVGAKFDIAYVRAMALDTRQALAVFGDYARTGSDPELKAFVQGMIPALRERLQTARAIVDRIDPDAAAWMKTHDIRR